MTDKNGNQSVQCINNELGMNKTSRDKDRDKEKIREKEEINRRLAQQGIEGEVTLYGTADNNMDKPKSFRRGANLPGKYPGSNSGI